MLLYLIRHGETDKNKDKLLQGQSDSELNEYGRELARKTSEGLKDVAFDYIFTSPLKRAKETAQIVMAKRKIPFYEEIRIQEISFGDYEGLCFGEENYNIPSKEFLAFFDAPEKYTTPPNGETFEEVIKRTGEFLEEIISNEEYQDKIILISTHGCALKALLANIRGTETSEFWGEGVHRNCAVTMVEVKDGKMIVLEEGKIYYEP